MVIGTHAVRAVAGDDVPRRRCRAPDRIFRGSEVDYHSVRQVSDGGATRDVGADEVSLHHAAREGPADGDTWPIVARDDVARAGCRSPDCMTGEVSGLSHDEYTGAVADRSRARSVGPNEVALHQVPGRPRRDQDAGIVVARDNVARRGGRPANRIVRARDIQPVKGVPQVHGSRSVSADEATLEDVSPVSAQLHPVAAESIDDQP
jgi:hypothetical protein